VVVGGVAQPCLNNNYNSKAHFSSEPNENSNTKIKSGMTSKINKMKKQNLQAEKQKSEWINT